MTDFLKADIFFFVTTIAVILVTVIAIVALVYVIRILRNVDEISETAKIEAHRISADLDEARNELRKSAGGLKKYFDFFKALIGIRKKRKSDRQKE